MIASWLKVLFFFLGRAACLETERGEFIVPPMPRLSSLVVLLLP